MVMLNKYVAKKWISKYSHTQFFMLTPGTINWYKYCENIGRREYLKLSRKKTKKFNKKHPNNLLFRVIKHNYLKDKNLKPEVMLKIQKLIEKNGTSQGMKEVAHLKGLTLYNCLKRRIKNG